MPGCAIVVQTDNHVGTTRLWAQRLGMNMSTIRRQLCDLPRGQCQRYLMMRKLLSRLTAAVGPEEPENEQATFYSWTANLTGSESRTLGIRLLTGSCVRVSGNNRALHLAATAKQAAMKHAPEVLALPPAAVEVLQTVLQTESSQPG
mmetsp:Transcript_13653/g.26390  ORF Transcript_13653/g.26390 Transcript_13653/m.26390 type:complete len:147 (-) Transcript_13653:484-924(-)